MIEDIRQMLDSGCERMILSKPVQTAEYRKIVIEKKEHAYQIQKYTQKQVFHENIQMEELAECLEAWLLQEYRQLNGFGNGLESIFLISKKGKVTYRQKRTQAAPKTEAEHNRRKKYLLPEGEIIPPLVDMGIFTSDGKIIASMYDKFRQINRFIEIIDDLVKDRQKKELHIIDFGCGKSYLTFILYYYLTQKRGIKVQMVGLDLKEDVIRKCNLAAEKYGYTGLSFELGDINGYQAPFSVDMVVTLHACDTATDYALYNAICWDAEMIFSVPCCQHEINSQMEREDADLMMRYGIIKERYAALMTDAIRANLLECYGYRTQVMEFVDLSHTPKNLLIRAMKRKRTDPAHRQKMEEEIRAMIGTYQLKPTLYELLENREKQQ